jgi:predicted nucleotidyltransferase component of viral defense system
MVPKSKYDLKRIAHEHGYRPEILEKVYRLLELIEMLMSVPFLRNNLALKGGTAINLFCTDKLPRLSLDADFNYIGALDRATMLKDKGEIDRLILDICQRNGYELYRNPRAHAGGKMVLIYQSLLGGNARLELDLNYIYRAPLWPVQLKSSLDWLKRIEVPVLDIHELAAGKLHALLDREASRDLFDSYDILKYWNLDNEKLRLAFTVYAGMRAQSWKKIDTSLIQFEINDVKNKLIPVLKQKLIPSTKTRLINDWAITLTEDCIKSFSKLLPFSDQEKTFLSCLEEDSEIRPELLSHDAQFCHSVKHHPGLLWRIKQLQHQQ